MKMKYFFVNILLFCTFCTHAQIDAGDLMQLKKGTTLEISNIVSPSSGMLVYNIEDDNIYKYDGSQWVKIGEANSISNTNGTGNRIATFTSPNGTMTDIKETVSTLVNNGDGSFTFTNEAGTSTTIISGFSPIVTSMSPNSCLHVGGPYNVIISGDYFEGSSTVTLSGQTVNSISVLNSTTISANITIVSLASPSNLTVTNIYGSTTLANVLGIGPSAHTISDSEMTLNGLMSNTSGKIHKSSGSSYAWNGEAYSLDHFIPAVGEGSLEYRDLANDGWLYRMVGLSETPSLSSSYTNLDYAIYRFGWDNIYVFEKGVNWGWKTRSNPGDIFRISKDCNGVVKYYKNNVVFYTSLTKSYTKLYFDSSFYTVTPAGRGIDNIIMTY